MTTPAHIATGYLIAHAFVQAHIIPAEFETHAITIGILAANAPDFDTIAFWRVLRHRTRSPFHKPILWLVLLTPLFLYTNLAELPYQFSLTLLVGTCILSHFILDSIDFTPGITWLWPFSHKQYHLWKKSLSEPKSLRDAIQGIRRNPMLVVDLAYSFFTYFLYKRLG